MKNVNSILAIILLAVMAGCGGDNKSNNENEAFLVVDVTKSYPKKDLILQDFMDVEYIPLETTDEFVNQGVVRDIGEKIIVVGNSSRNGDIFLYDRTGKGLRKFNHMGQGPEDYTNISGITLDEENNEIFVSDLPARNIFVYDLFGRFKRSLRYNEEGARYSNLYNFDKESLICKDATFDRNKEATDKPPFVILSKQDGSIVKDIQIPYEQKISSQIMMTKNGFTAVFPIGNLAVIPYQNSWILSLPSSDTVFNYLQDHSMIPFLVRTPSIHSMNPEVFLFPEILTKHYYFLQATKNSPEINGTTLSDMQMSIPKTFLAYDRKEKVIFEYTVCNGDYSNKQTVDMSQPTISDEIAFWQKIESYQLVDSYEKGELNDGKLKDIAAKLDPEDNPVIMLVKHKK